MKGKYLLLLLIFLLIPPLARAEAQPVRIEYGKDYVLVYDGHAYTISLGRANVYDFRSGKWVPLLCYKDKDGSYVLRTGLAAVRVYESFAKYYDPNLSEELIARAEWCLLKKEGIGKFSAWIPVTFRDSKVEMDSNRTHAWIHVVREGEEGTLEIWYYGEWGSGIKHTVRFTSNRSGEFKLVWNHFSIPLAELVRKGKEIVKTRMKLREECIALCDERRVARISFARAWKHYLGSDLIPTGFGLDMVHEFGTWVLKAGESFELDPTTTTISPPTDDTYIDSGNPATNYGSAIYLYAWLNSTSEARILIKFDLSSIPAGAKILNATLYLFGSSVPYDPPAMDCHRITSSWDELTVTWDTAPTIVTTPTSSTIPARGWNGWNVTTDVQDIVNGESNYGWMLKYQADSKETRFIAKEYDGYDPQLNITYTTNNPPNKPELASPYPNGTIIHVLNSWLNVTVTDPDGDAMNLSFYWSNDTLIGTLENVANGSTVGIQVSNLAWNTDYYWYVNVTDGYDTNQSDTFHFKTKPPGCVLWFPMDEGSGSVVHDRSGNGNDGTIYGAQWVYVNRSFGYALDFDGDDDYIYVAPADSLDFCEAVTVRTMFCSAIDRTEEENGWYGYTKKDQAWILGWQGWADGFSFGIYNSSAVWLSGATVTDYYLTADKWEDVFGTFEGRYTKIYINGEAKNTKDYGTEQKIRLVSYALYIGTGNYYWYGKLDEIQVYSRNLTPSEISQLHTLMSTVYEGDSAINITWDAWSYAEKYYYEVYQDDFSTLYASGSTTSTFFQITYDGGHKYYVRIIAEDTSQAVNTTWYVCSFYVDPPGCVLWLPLDEGSGTVAIDRSGEGNNGTIYGASWVYVNRSLGYALYFDGTDDYVEVSSGFLPTTSITVTAWVKGTAILDKWTKWLNTGPSTVKGIYGTGFDLSGDKIGLTISFDDGAKRFILDRTDVVNSWVQIAIAWNGSYASGYLNGDLAKGGSITGTPDWADRPLFVGSNYLGTENFQGIIDEVSVYSRSLNEIEQNQSHALLATPLNNNSITIKWQEWSYAERYCYEVYQDNFSTLYASGSVTTNETTISFDSGHRYYVKIIAEDTSLSTNTTWYVCSFYADLAPNKPTLNSPTDGTITNDLSMVLNATYTDPEGDSGFLEFYDNTSGTPVLMANASVSNGSWVAYTWSNLTRGTTYKWFVKSRDKFGRTNTSEERSFYVNIPPSISFVQSQPFSVPQGGTVTVSLDGSDIEDSKSELTVKVNLTSQSGALVVQNGIASLDPSSGEFKYTWEVPGGAETGAYKLDAIIIDSDGGTNTTTKIDAFEVISSAPSGGGGGGGGVSSIQTPPPTEAPQNETLIPEEATESVELLLKNWGPLMFILAMLGVLYMAFVEGGKFS